MADASLSYEIVGKTDVPQNVDKSKAAMGQMERAVEGLNKKMESFGKDIILSYIAPMVLINKAIDYVANKVEEQRQKAKEALEFAAKGESKELEPSTVKAARNIQERAKEVDEKQKAATARAVVAEDFLRNASDKDMERFYKRLGPGSRLMLTMATYESASKDQSVQNAVRDILNANMLREEETAAKVKTGIDTMGVQNAVFGMGTSPIIASMQDQLDVQRQQAETLRRIEDRLPPREEDYTRDGGTPYRPTITFR